MVTENISIDVRPGGVPVVIHVTQYEAGLRQFIFTPYTSGGTLTAVAGSATLEGTKPDGYAFQQACEMVDGVITYTLQEQLCAVEGRVWSRLVIRDTDGGMIGYTAIVWVVGRAGVADDAVMSDSDISALRQFLDEFGTIDAYRGALNGALAAVGGPLVAATASAMTDTTKVYVYTGSESGYTEGHWYYWNGSAWTDGGVYQSTGINTDKTLTVEDMAADAKATGDAVGGLKTDLNTLIDAFSVYDELTPDTTVTDNLFRWTNKTNYASVGALYRIYTIQSTVSILKITGRNFGARYYSLYAFENADGEIISHYEGTNYTNVTDLEVAVPNGAVKVYVNGQDDTAIKIPPSVKANALIDVGSKFDTDKTLTVEDMAADAKATGDQITELKNDLNKLDNDLSEFIDTYSEYDEITPDTTVTDNLFRWTNKTNFASVGALYRIYTIPSTVSILKITGRNFYAQYYSLYAFEDANGDIINHYAGANYTNVTDLEVPVPVGAVKVYVNGQDDTAIKIPPSVKANILVDVVGKIKTLESDVDILKSDKTITLSCWGDSVTDGAFVSGEHGAEYGKSTYPARLQTLLTDGGYDAQVINSGVAGERTPDTTIRVGGFPCILTEDITIPADNTPQPLGTNLSSSRGRVFGTTIQIPLTGRDGTDFCVYFTAISVSKSPDIYMDGLELVVSRGSASPYPNYIAKKVNDNKSVTIPKGTMLFTSDDRNTDINIVMVGINDQYALRMSDWVTMMEKCMQASNRCLIVSPWIPLFNAWYDMSGTTTAEKYAEFLREANSKFGIYHVDMYALWYKHALEYALASGYLTDLTTEQKTAIQNKLDNHIIPAEFTYNNTDGDAHLNEVGYHVVAMIIFDRLKRVSFI